MNGLECWTNPMDEYKNTRQKSAAILDAKQKKVCAIDASGKEHPIERCTMRKLAFVAGLWRVQSDFSHKITRIRDKDMVLMNKLNHKENTGFEYWTAKLVGYNCYGPFIIDGNSADFIVSRCVINKSDFWGYGPTIESARAFLGLKIWDEMRDVIHAAVFSDKTK